MDHSTKGWEILLTKLQVLARDTALVSEACAATYVSERPIFQYCENPLENACDY